MSARSYTRASWRSMLSRCHDMNHVSFKHYGARGVRVTERWHVFDNFLSDMGLRPDDHVIARKDHEQDYSKDNCSWEHRSLVSKRKRGESCVTINGQTHTLTQWARISGVHRTTLIYRLRNGWPCDEALLKPGPYSVIREDAETILAALFKDIDTEGPPPILAVPAETWARIQKFMSQSRHLLVA